MRPFRFGYQCYSADSAKEWKDKARRAEDLGYSVFSLADHYIGPGPALAATRHPVQVVAAVPAMTLAAEVTDTIRIGARVMCIDYRNPVVLAKEMATIDLFSEGRLELGLGAGWLRGEYEAMGVPFDPAGVRITRLGDVVALVKACMADGETDLDAPSGVHAVGFEGVPKTPQRPHPPLMIGGGSKRVLQLAAREADIVSFNFNNASGMIGPDVAHSGQSGTEAKIGWVREAAGDRLDRIELEIGAYFTMVTDDADAGVAQLSGLFGLPAEEIRTHPHVLVGSVEGIAEELLARRERYGISYVTVGDAAAADFAPVVARLTGT